MKELKGQDRNDYLLKNARLIFAYYGERNQFNKYYQQYQYFLIFFFITHGYTHSLQYLHSYLDYLQKTSTYTHII